MRIASYFIITFLCLFFLAEESFAQCLSGTTISSSMGNTEIAVCSTTDVPERIYIEPSTFATRYAYLITDSENVIVRVSNSPLINLSTLEAGDYRIWGLSYGGVLSAAPGVDLDTDPLSDFCFELSENFLTLSRGLVSGGTVQTTAGETDVLACVSDGEADIFEFENTGSSSENYAYVVTDDNNVILAISEESEIDFENAGAGICRVWGLAYTGELTATAGENAAEAMLSTGCFELSENFVTVTRNEVDGGMVMMPNGLTERLTCPDDGNPDIVRFDSTDVVGENFTYLITDDQNNILAIPEGDFADLDGAGPGACRIWGLSYTGNLTAALGENAAEAILSDECFDLSDNFILVVRVIPDAGTIATTDGTTTVSLCANEEQSTQLTFSLSDNTVIPPLAYVLTDEENVIIELSTDNEIDFEGRNGTFRVHALSYTGTLTAEVGDDADEVALSDDCFDLSDNFVTVTAANADGGTVATEAGETELTVCVDDGEPDVVRFDSMAVAENANFTYVVTDDNNVILAVPGGDQADFEGAGAGVCRVWGLSYTGSLTAMAGDTASAIALSDECFDLSDNFITVNRLDIEAGTIALADGSDSITVCAGDDETDFITFSIANNTPDQDFRLVLTDPNDRILFFYNPNDTVLDLTGIIPAEYHLYSVSYSGNFTGETEINLAEAVFSDQCFSLTENFVSINAIDVDGGTVSTTDDATEVAVCAGDGMSDEISFQTTSNSLGNYTFVVTDENNVILSLPAGTTIDFENAGAGICKVWGLAFTGDIIAEVGDTANLVALSDGCFELSENFVTVDRTDLDAGMVTITDGSTDTTIIVDGVADELTFANTADTSGANFTYVVTDDNNVILALPGGNTVDFDPAGLGICRVWGLVYTGEITAMQGDTASAVALSDGCFELSSNFVTVNRVEAPCLAEAGTLTADTTTVVLDNDTVTISATLNGDQVVPEGYEQVFVLTTPNGGDLVLQAVSETPSFEVTATGTYTIHTLIAELSDTSDANYLDLSVVEFGTTTAFDVLDLISANDLCADLDAVGATVTVVAPEPCLAEAGTLTADADTVTLENDMVTISATPNNDMVVPNVYEFVYVLTSGPNLVIEATSETPSFEVSDTGLYTIHSLVAELSDDADPNFLDLSVVEFGITTAAQVLDLITQNDICADLDAIGAPITVIAPEQCLAEAGTLTADSETVTLENDSVTISATPNGDRVVPAGYEFLFVLTSGEDLVIEAVGDSPNFSVADTGLFTIHTLVAELSDDTDPNFLDLSVVEFGVTTGVDVVNLLLQNELCADLDAVGAPVNVVAPEPGLTPAEVFLISGSTDTTICVDGIADKLTFGTTADTTSNFNFVVTDDENNILQVLPGNMVDFDPAGVGVCRTWGLSYFGNLTVGDALYSETFDQDSVGVSGDCPDSLLVNCDFYNLPPDNEQWTIGTEADADSVFLNDEDYFQTVNGALEARDLNTEFCFESSLIDISGRENVQFSVEITETGDIEPEDYIDVILIVDGTEMPITNFSGLGDSEHTLVGDQPDDEDFNAIFVTQGGITGESLQIKICVQNNAAAEFIRIDNVNVSDCTVCGQNATEATFADSTFVLSSNFVNINRIATDGGMVTLTSGSTDTTVVVSDGVSDKLMFTTTADTTAGNYTYLITDNDNNILVVSPGNMADFDGAGVGICRIWGLAYTGNLIASVDDNAAEAALSDQCFSLSENFITVNRIEEGTACTADAGSIAPAAGSVALFEGIATISGIPAADTVVPEGYELIYVLTSGENLVIEDTNDAPEFTVDTTGTFTIHTLVAELNDPVSGNFLDLSIIEFGLTTGSDVLALIDANNICADLDVEGATVEVTEEAQSCIANAGTLTADATTVTLIGSGTMISATPDGNAELASGFEVIYVLTTGSDFIIEAINTVPSFVVEEPGDYRIHTFIGELDDTRSPDYFDISSIEFGVTTGLDVIEMLLASGVCADLDPVGAAITVAEAPCLADAGTLTAEADTVQIANGLAFLAATSNGDAVVPDGYEQVYVLTRGEELTLIAPNVSMPSFSVMSPGLYTIHTLVAELTDQNNPNFLDLTTFMFGTSTGVDVANFIDTSGICASLDAVGAPIIVEDEEGTNLNNATAQLTVGPNPASDIVTVTLENEGAFEPSETVRLHVYNLNGQLLETRRIQVNEGLNQYELETFGLQSGLYLIRIEGEQQAVQEQFVKARR